MQMNGHLSEYDEKAITDVFLHEKNAGIIGGYCELYGVIKNGKNARLSRYRFTGRGYRRNGGKHYTPRRYAAGAKRPYRQLLRGSDI